MLLNLTIAKKEVLRNVKIFKTHEKVNSSNTFCFIASPMHAFGCFCS